MLKKRWPNRVISDSGFEVQLLGRIGIKYKQGAREVIVDSELLAGKEGVAVFTDSLKKGTPHSRKSLSRRVNSRR